MTPVEEPTTTGVHVDEVAVTDGHLKHRERDARALLRAHGDEEKRVLDEGNLTEHAHLQRVELRGELLAKLRVLRVRRGGLEPERLHTRDHENRKFPAG